MGSYLDQLKKTSSSDAYQKLMDAMKYTANDAYGGVAQDYQAQIFTPLKTDAPKKLEMTPVKTVFAGNDEYGNPTYKTEGGQPQSGTPTYGDNGTGDIVLTGYTKDMGTINGLPVTANYDPQGNLTGYQAAQNYRSFLDGSHSVGGAWDASGKPTPQQHSSGSGGFLGNTISDIGGGLSNLYMSLRDPVEAAAVVAGNYLLPGSSLVTSQLASDKAKEMLSSDVGQAANIAAGVTGGMQGNLNNYGEVGRSLGITSAPAESLPGAVPQAAAPSISEGIASLTPEQAAQIEASNAAMSAAPNYLDAAGQLAPVDAAAATAAMSSAAADPYSVEPPMAAPAPEPSGLEQLAQLASNNPWTTAALAATMAATAGNKQADTAQIAPPTPTTYNMKPYEFQRTYNTPQDMIGKTYAQGQTSGERNWMTDVLTPQAAYTKTEQKAAGGEIQTHEGLMNLHHNAQNLAAQGRHGDDTLVHMNRNELAGLQALAQAHGKTLHTNPHTGMPEAFSLSQELGNATSGIGAPVLGAGLSVLSGGTIDPITAAAIVGGTQTLASGNLQKGLMAGLGAWGGASLGAGLSNIGQSALGTEAYSAANAAGATPEALQSAVSDKIAAASPWDTLKAGASEAWKDPKAALAALGSGSTWGGAGVLGAAAAPFLADKMVQTSTPAPAQNQGLIRPYTFQRRVNTPSDMVQPTFQPGQSTRERNWFEDTMTARTPYQAPGPEYTKTYAEGGDVGVDPNLQQVPAFDPVVRMAGGGGIPSLGGYAAGGNPHLLKGPGDGMSDNIPAVIGDKQPARLADGEFVVPADVVSHLGNGSTDAGAKQLYKMMDRIRQQRTGKKKQAPQVNPSKAMPA